MAEVNIGIIVYSQTGHTLSIAVKLQKALSAAGHTVNLEQIKTAGPVGLTAPHIPLKTRPEIAGYDALVFGAPAWGGAPAPPMTSYLEQLGSLHGIPVAFLVTGFFPPGLGRNQTLARMVELCKARGAIVRGSGSVGLWSWRRKRLMNEAIQDLCHLF